MADGIEKGARYYDVHGSVVISLVGHDPVSNVMDRTLDFFKSSPKTPDLTLVFGEYPSTEWKPSGTLIGDRILYDPDANTTTVLRNRTIKQPERSEADYIVCGNLRTSGEPVAVYIPRLQSPLSSGGSFGRDLRRGSVGWALLAASGNPFGMRHVVRQAERITEAVVEPFLFYRLPEKGLSLVHGASVCSGDGATLFAGSANIGKSTLMLDLVKGGMAFLGDTLVILSREGDVLAYPGLVKLHGGHLASIPELTNRLASGMGRIGAYLLKRELATRPKEALEFLPQRKMSELFDGVVIGEKCKLQTVVLIRRGSFPGPKSVEINADDVSRALSAELYWDIEAGRWRNGQFAYAGSAAMGRDFFGETTAHHASVDDIIREGVSRTRCYRVELPLEAPVRLIEDLLWNSPSERA